MTEAQLKPSGPAYIGQAILVIDHAIDDRVRGRTFEAEEHFASIVKAEAKSTNVDSAATPDTPRLVLADNHKQIFLSQSRMQFVLSFERGFGVRKAHEVITKHVDNFFHAASKFQRLDANSEIGFVLLLNQPCANEQGELADFLASKFYSGKRLGSPSTFELKLGFETEQRLFKNLNFRIYEVKQMMIPPGGQGVMKIADVPTTEQGIGCTLDVNTRPRVRKHDKTEFMQSASDVLSAMEHMLSSDLAEISPALASQFGVIHAR